MNHHPVEWILIGSSFWFFLAQLHTNAFSVFFFQVPLLGRGKGYLRHVTPK